MKSNILFLVILFSVGLCFAQQKGRAEIAERISDQNAQRSLQDHCIYLTSCLRCPPARRRAPDILPPAANVGINTIKYIFNWKEEPGLLSEKGRRRAGRQGRMNKKIPLPRRMFIHYHEVAPNGLRMGRKELTNPLPRDNLCAIK